MLATVPAAGTAGLLAKARTPKVDVERSQEIAATLAEDREGGLS